MSRVLSRVPATRGQRVTATVMLSVIVSALVWLTLHHPSESLFRPRDHPTLIETSAGTLEATTHCSIPSTQISDEETTRPSRA